MKIVYLRLSAASFSFLAALALVSGCSSTAPERAAMAVDSIDGLVSEMKNVQGGVDQALAALDALVSKPSDDLKGQFDAYTQSVAALDQHAKAVGDRAEAMKARGQEYFKGWEETSASLSSDEMRQYSEERRAKLNAAYSDIQEKTSEAKEEFAPFITSLKDVQSYLSLDLTTTGLQSVGDLAKKAKSQGADLKESIDSVVKDLETVRGLLAQKVETAPATK